MKKHIIPLYGLDVYFTNDEAEAHAFLKRHGADDEAHKAIDNSGGIYHSFEDSSDKTWRVMCVFDGSLPSIAHEATHAAIEISEFCNMKVNFENSEPVAYLVQWFTQTMLQMFQTPKGKVKS